jgi:hypothetical protein
MASAMSQEASNGLRRNLGISDMQLYIRACVFDAPE